MKLDKIYIGYTRDYKEHLLEDRGTYFLDLLTDNLIFKSDLYLDLLQPISVLDDTHKWRLLGSLKRLYEKDRERKIDTTKLYIGDACQIEHYGSLFSAETHMSLTVKRNALLYKIGNKQYKIIETSKVHITPLFFEKGKIYINEENLESFNGKLISTNIRLSNATHFEIVVNQTKKKVLESYHYILGNSK